MHLSKWSYHADFAVYPPWILTSAVWQWWHLPFRAMGSWLAAAGMGWLAWTAIEYLLHRWLLHCVPPFNRLHAMHHTHPGAWIGTPTWLSVCLFVVMWTALRQDVSAPVSGGLADGMMSGYLVYAVVHHAVHHWRARPGSWLYRAKLRHARHHRAGASADFGVSTGVWDAVLRTAGGRDSSGTLPEVTPKR